MNLPCYLIFVICLPPYTSSFHPYPVQDQILQSQILTKQQLQDIEQRLVRLFGLPSKKLKRRDHQRRLLESDTKFLLEIYNNDNKNLHPQPEGRSWIRHKRTVEKSNYIVTFGTKRHTWDLSRSYMVLGFNLSRAMDPRRLIAAELRLFRTPVSGYRSQRYQVSTYGFGKKGTVVLDRHVWGPEDRGWMVLNATGLFVDGGRDFAKIWVSSSDGQRKARVVEDVGISGMRSPLAERPFLVAYFDADLRLKSHRRTGDSENKCRNRRSTEPVFQQPIPSRCTMKLLYVEFEKLDKMTSIIAPKIFLANYCIGKCSFPLQGKATNHAIIQALCSTVKSSLAPVCAPKELSPMNVIHYDVDGNAILKTYDDMIVENCACH